MKIHTCPSVGKYYGHLLSDQLIVFVEMQNFKDNVFAKINNSHGVVIKLWCLQLLSMTLHYHYCMTVNNIRVPYQIVIATPIIGTKVTLRGT